MIGRGWAEYRDLSVASRSIICRSRRLRQIIDLRDTDKSRYFAITEFNNCFISRSPSLLFNQYLWEAKRSAIFTQEWSQEGERYGFLYAWADYLQPNTVGWYCTWADHFCRQLFAGQVVGSRPMKRKKNLLWMIFALLFIQNILLFLIGCNIRLILHNQQALKRRMYT